MPKPHPVNVYPHYRKTLAYGRPASSDYRKSVLIPHSSQHMHVRRQLTQRKVAYASGELAKSFDHSHAAGCLHNDDDLRQRGKGNAAEVVDSR